MKTLKIIVAMLFYSTAVLAQEKINEIKPKPKIKTVLGKDSRISGFGSLELKATEFKSELTLLPGFSGGMILNDHFVVGIGGYGIATRVGFQGVNPVSDQFLYGGYGGLLLGAIIAPKEVIHVYIPILIGAGGAYITEESPDDINQNDDAYDESSAFFVVEPGIELEVNITKFFRLGIGGSYRFIKQSDLENFTDNELSNYSGNISMKFGGF
ncbi:MAG: hypothetical protein ABJH05_17555 [Fulvivirga sp.]